MHAGRTLCAVVIQSSPSVMWRMSGVQNMICWC